MVHVSGALACFNFVDRRFGHSRLRGQIVLREFPALPRRSESLANRLLVMQALRFSNDQLSGSSLSPCGVQAGGGRTGGALPSARWLSSLCR